MLKPSISISVLQTSCWTLRDVQWFPRVNVQQQQNQGWGPSASPLPLSGLLNSLFKGALWLLPRHLTVRNAEGSHFVFHNSSSIQAPPVDDCHFQVTHLKCCSHAWDLSNSRNDPMTPLTFLKEMPIMDRHLCSKITVKTNVLPS